MRTEDGEATVRRIAAAVWGPGTIVDTETARGVTAVRVWSLVANELRQYATRTYSHEDPAEAWRIAAASLRDEAASRRDELRALVARIDEALS